LSDQKRVTRVLTGTLGGERRIYFMHKKEEEKDRICDGGGREGREGLD
jgi:hypothetical protein